ncbi:MAG: 30S ribosomal protein S8e [Nanoarchaeota archaeon]
MKSQFRSRRKASGGRYKAIRKKKLREIGRDPMYTLIGKNKVNLYKATGGEVKRSLIRAEEANVFDGSKHKKVKILSVVDNKANRHFIRRNIITKGAVLKTELGDAVVVNRPGQEGHINATLLK